MKFEVYFRASSFAFIATGFFALLFMVFMAVVIIFGHWLDFYQMIFASIDPHHVNIGMLLLDLGIAAGFIGIILNSAGRAMSKTPLIAKNHPFTKESIIHHT